MKNTLSFGNKKGSGIYQIYNTITNNYYVGSAVNLSRRFSQHKWALSRNMHPNKHLQSAWNKYGAENFEFRLLEYCDEEKVIEREQFYFDSLKPHYNLNPKAANCAGRKLSPEHIESIRKANIGRKLTEQQRKEIGNRHRGKKLTLEQKQRLSEVNKGKVMSQETRDKIGKSSKGRKKKSIIHTTKLSTEEVQIIKQLLCSGLYIRQVYTFLLGIKHITFSQIADIKAGRTWKSIQCPTCKTFH